MSAQALANAVFWPREDRAAAGERRMDFERKSASMICPAATGAEAESEKIVSFSFEPCISVQDLVQDFGIGAHGIWI